MSGIEQADCPNCGQSSDHGYDNESDQVWEFDCTNSNCRCEVFRA